MQVSLGSSTLSQQCREGGASQQHTDSKAKHESAFVFLSLSLSFFRQGYDVEGSSPSLSLSLSRSQDAYRVGIAVVMREVCRRLIAQKHLAQRRIHVLDRNSKMQLT